MQQLRFLEWQVYKEARELSVTTINLVRKLPKEYRFELGSQMIRASLSIGLNIAEGSGKKSDTELGRFLDISLGSLYETLACADIFRHGKLITQEDFHLVESRVLSIAKQLGGFKRGLDLKVVGRRL